MMTFKWRTDAAHGEIEAPSLEAAIAELISEREWYEIDSVGEENDIQDGAWLVIADQDGQELYRRD